ncbi:hypothetical protein Pyn_23542 [Prunus yedoensis var. nudiflora]|uniref:NADPH:adrenodoxin oxidoreductase mitochondrial n=1 Tax=Prunus yedoensis var. nudiflora TaxID=2094558 RepID=A0A314YF27_PRUYE|nr:hypothetical protein Pyn_23542 [Prunus yedoensis var. nudiflora]
MGFKSYLAQSNGVRPTKQEGFFILVFVFLSSIFISSSFLHTQLQRRPLNPSKPLSSLLLSRRNQRLCVRHCQTALSHHLSEPNLAFSHPSFLSSSLTEALSAPILSAQNPSQAILSVIQRPLSLRFSQSRHLSQSPPSLSVAAITDSAQQFAAISSFYLPLFLSVSSWCRSAKDFWISLQLFCHSLRKVYLVGRRGPAQAVCTARELREIIGIKDLHVHIKEADLLTTPEDEDEMRNNRIRKRVYELLSKAATTRASHPSSDPRELHFVFFRKPDKFLESNERSGHVSGVRLEKTKLVGDRPGERMAAGTGQFEGLGCGIVLKSIGYKSIPVDGLPFDHRKGVVPNVRGRVLSDTSGDPMLLEKGLYVCGWLKRGPTGIIATNLYCAEETVASISEDLKQGVLASSSSSGREGLLQLLDSRNVRVIPFDGWEKIDSEERRLGSLRNKPREKLATWEELQKVATE